MDDLVAGACGEVQTRTGLTVLAHRRWLDPQPGSPLAVISQGATWSAMRSSAESPTLVVQVYGVPTSGRADAEGQALHAARLVRMALHRPQGGSVSWGGVRVLSCLLNGSGAPGEVEGHESWVSIRQVYEVLAG